MSGWLRLLAVGCLGLVTACGDGVVIISVNSGVIVGEPFCDGLGGQFQLRDQGGLTVLVVITGNTSIVVAGGGVGRCTDLSANTPVEVSGHESGNRVIASSISIQGGPRSALRGGGDRGTG